MKEQIVGSREGETQSAPLENTRGISETTGPPTVFQMFSHVLLLLWEMDGNKTKLPN